jgi:plasmid stabilization system protein ParE
VKVLRIHELARRDANQATVWYAERNPSAARRFWGELLGGFSNAAAFPLRYPSYLHGTRRILLRRFPYFIVFFDWQDEVYVVPLLTPSGARVTGDGESRGLRCDSKHSARYFKQRIKS